MVTLDVHNVLSVEVSQIFDLYGDKRTLTRTIRVESGDGPVEITLYAKELDGRLEFIPEPEELADTQVVDGIGIVDDSEAGNVIPVDVF